jgi:heptosyltransferase I
MCIVGSGLLALGPAWWPEARRPEPGAGVRILIVRLGALGDIVHALPACAAIRRAHPDARIDWLVSARHEGVLRHVRGIDERITMGLSSRWSGLVATVRRLRAARYDAALDFQGLIKSAAFARWSGARRVIGFDRPAVRESLAARFYRERAAVDDRQHVIRKNLALASLVGADPSAIVFPFDVPPSPLSDQTPYALLNAGAGWPNKRWPPDRFGTLATWLRDRFGWRSLVLWGPREQGLAQLVVNVSKGAAVLAPRTSIGDMLALARDARVFVSGDTGPLHLAAAMRTPVVGVYGPTSPDRNGPFDPADVCVSRFTECVCHHERRCRRSRPCIGSISVSEVREAIERRVRAAATPVTGTP